jgi:hypothetical protein
MNLKTLTSKEVSKIQKLIERKESLIAHIVDIDAELSAMELGDSVKAPSSKAAADEAAAPRRKTSPAKPQKDGNVGKARAGKLKERIERELKAAGPKGVKVADLAARLDTTYGNLTAFFIRKAKQVPEIQKVAPARFAWIK